MTQFLHEKKLAQFSEFFSIAHSFSLNIDKLDNDSVNIEMFEQSMPVSFKIASEIVSIDQSSINPIASLKSEATQLAAFLNSQSQKINLLIGYILNQEDKPEKRFDGIQIGGGGIVFKSTQPFDIAQYLSIKLFLSQENIALFCYGEVIEEIKEDTYFTYKVIFSHIREEDREILVRESLRQQSKQLQQLAQLRNQKQEGML